MSDSIFTHYWALYKFEDGREELINHGKLCVDNDTKAKRLITNMVSTLLKGASWVQPNAKTFIKENSSNRLILRTY